MNDDNRVIFARNLQYFLEKNGKTQSDLTSDLGLKQSTVSDWVNGKKFPRIDTLQMLADYFCILKSDLTETKKPTPEDVSHEHEELMRLYDSAKPEFRAAALALLKSAAAADKAKDK